MGRSAKTQCVRTSKPHPAVTTEKISFSGSTYELDLCEEHADALYRDLFGWARLGRDVSAVERARRTEEERSTKIVFPVSRRVEVEEPVKAAPKTRTVVSTLPAKAEAWRLSPHAQERCQQRSITREQALWAAVDPAVDRPSIADDPFVRVRTRGTTVAVVDADRQRIITVWDSSTPKSEQQQELEYATSHIDAA